jgi:hypothetical protein
MLFQLGPLTISVMPFNADKSKRVSGADFAVKPVVGAQQPREFMGEADEKITLSGTIFPVRFGGLDELAILNAMRASGEPQILIRNDGANLGWFLVERVEEEANLAGSMSAVGSSLRYTIELVKSPNPASVDAIIATMIQLFS